MKERFKVSEQAIDDLSNAPQLPDSQSAERDPFEVSSRAAHELGQTIGDTSAADELLADLPEIIDTSVETEAQRAARNFSFTGGETSPVFSRLPADSQKRLRKLRDKFIKQYADRGITEQTIGLLAVNSLDDGMRGSGTMQFPGSSRDYHYQLTLMAHLGQPIENRQTKSRSLESETARLKYRSGDIFRVADLASTEAFDWIRLSQCMGGPWFEWATALPRPVQGTWLPTIKLDGRII